MPPRDFTTTPTLDPIEDITRRRLLTSLPAIGLFAAGINCGDDDDSGADDETRSFEHWGGVAEIPVQPKRVVTLHDSNALLPLLEFGWKPVGSVGETSESGAQQFRYTQEYDTSDIAYVGDAGAPDLEAITVLEPDLIVTNEGDDPMIEALRKIAPTVQIQTFGRPMAETMRQFADLTGSFEKLDSLTKDYEAAVSKFRADLPRPAGQITLSMVQFGTDGTFYLGGNGEPVEMPVRDIGFARPAPQADAGLVYDIPLERIREHDGDVMLTANWPGWTPEVEAMKQPVVASLDVMKRGEFHVYDGDIATGTSFGRMHAFMDILRGLLIDREVNFPA